MTTNIMVKLDNSIQTSSASLSQINAALGLTAGVAEPVLDQDGKLVQVILRFPDTVSQEAIDKTAANIGVATSFLCPPQLALADLNDAAPDGLVLASAMGASEEWSLKFARFTTALGTLNQTGGVGIGTYTDGLDDTIPSFIFLTLTNLDTVNTMTWAAATDLTVNLPSGGSIVLAPVADIVLGTAKPTGSAKPIKTLYASIEGDLFLRRESDRDGNASATFSYDAACENGAL